MIRGRYMEAARRDKRLETRLSFAFPFLPPQSGVPELFQQVHRSCRGPSSKPTFKFSKVPFNGHVLDVRHSSVNYDSSVFLSFTLYLFQSCKLLICPFGTLTPLSVRPPPWFLCLDFPTFLHVCLIYHLPCPSFLPFISCPGRKNFLHNFLSATNSKFFLSKVIE